MNDLFITDNKFDFAKLEILKHFLIGAIFFTEFNVDSKHFG